MNKEIEKKLLEIFFDNFNDEINQNEDYNEFLSTTNVDDLDRILKINSILDDDKKSFSEIDFYTTKEERIKKILDSKTIYENIIKNIGINLYDELEHYVNNYKYKPIKLDIDSLEYSPKFIEILKTNLIAKIRYNKNKNNLEIYSPKELIDELKILFKSKSLEKECEKNSEYIDNIKGLVAAYGVIELSNLKEIYNEVYGELSEENLKIRLLTNSIYDEGLHIVNEFSDYLIYGIGFENDIKAQEFLMKLPKKLGYKIYTKEQYEELREGSYHYEIDEFDTLYDFLSLKLHMNDDEIYEFDGMFVLDYMFSYQLDGNTAKRNLKNNIEKMMPDLDVDDKTTISKIILSIAKNYPTFKLKGHTYNEVGDKYR